MTCGSVFDKARWRLNRSGSESLMILHEGRERIGIDPKYKGGSIRMAAASAAIDRGVPIDVVLNTGRWASWQVFDKFYNRSRLQSSAPSIGLTSLA